MKKKSTDWSLDKKRKRKKERGMNQTTIIKEERQITTYLPTVWPKFKLSTCDLKFDTFIN